MWKVVVAVVGCDCGGFTPLDTVLVMRIRLRCSSCGSIACVPIYCIAMVVRGGVRHAWGFAYGALGVDDTFEEANNTTRWATFPFNTLCRCWSACIVLMVILVVVLSRRCMHGCGCGLFLIGWLYVTSTITTSAHEGDATGAGGVLWGPEGCRSSPTE